MNCEQIDCEHQNGVVENGGNIDVGEWKFDLNTQSVGGSLDSLSKRRVIFTASAILVSDIVEEYRLMMADGVTFVNPMVSSEQLAVILQPSDISTCCIVIMRTARPRPPCHHGAYQQRLLGAPSDWCWNHRGSY